ncbi:MAG: hypothetical protein V3V10_07190 [Planctomycetota bacterium]
MTESFALAIVVLIVLAALYYAHRLLAVAGTKTNVCVKIRIEWPVADGSSCEKFWVRMPDANTSIGYVDNALLFSKRHGFDLNDEIDISRYQVLETATYTEKQ